MTSCGGCKGLGAHAKICSKDKGIKAAMYYRAHYSLESLGDSIGSNDMGFSNKLWGLASEALDKAKFEEKKHG